jgi:hypothetical protein
MKRILALCLATALVGAAFHSRPGRSDDADPRQSRLVLVGGEALRQVEGELRAASSLFDAAPNGPQTDGAEDLGVAEERDMEALEKGLPGGVLTKGRLCLLLVDGRVLAKLRAAQVGRPNRIRAAGLLHDGGNALTPFRIEYLRGGQWVTFNLPASGTSGPSVLRGDE